MKLSFKEKIYCSVMWGLRHIFESNSDKSKIKYKIDTYEEYLLAGKISHMVCTCKSGWPKVDKFTVTSFGDALNLGAAVDRYEIDHKIRWLTFGDKSGIERWRQFSSSKVPEVRMDGTLYYHLKFAILMEFL